MNDGRCPAGRIVQNEMKTAGPRREKPLFFCAKKRKPKEEHLMY